MTIPAQHRAINRLENPRILLANSNQWYFNKLVKISCHKTPYRCPHRLNLSSQSSRSYAGPNTKVLKDKDLEFANSIPPVSAQGMPRQRTHPRGMRKLIPEINVRFVDGTKVFDSMGD